MSRDRCRVCRISHLSIACHVLAQLLVELVLCLQHVLQCGHIATDALLALRHSSAALPSQLLHRTSTLACAAAHTTTGVAVVHVVSCGTSSIASSTTTTSEARGCLFFAQAPLQLLDLPFELLCNACGCETAARGAFAANIATCSPYADGVVCLGHALACLEVLAVLIHLEDLRRRQALNLETSCLLLWPQVCSGV